MKTWIVALAFIGLFATSAVLTAADAAPRNAGYYDQSRARRSSGASWQCYPYCGDGTYKGRPVSEWLKPDRW
jgi:hypothetical protein